MKTILKKLSILFLFITVGTHAQDFEKVDNTVKTYPRSFITTDKFAERVTSDFSRDDEKARAIFTWIATNISYDLGALGRAASPGGFSYRTEEERLAKINKFKDDLALKTMRSRKGICHGYATLYAIVAEKAGLEAVVIPGASKTFLSHIGKAPGVSDHAWNAVKINGEWKLLDVTWGAGGVEGNTQKFTFDFNDSYFFMKPEDFYLKHYPEDEKWLMTRATKEEFAALPLYYGSHFRQGYKFISPDAGILTNKQSAIDFKIKGLSPDSKIGYAFSDERKLNKILPVFTGDIAQFKIPLDNKPTGILTIYVDEESVASYKIIKG